jgi:hypothetical protein
MALRLVPTHSLDAPIVVVMRDDDAWDVDRIDAEKSELRNPQEHPIERYFLGQTRYDIRPVSHYLKDGVQPTRFNMRRLTLNEWQHVENVRASNDHIAYSLALAYALESVDMPVGDDPIRLEGPKSKDRRLSQDDLELLDARGFRPYLPHLAMAAWRASLDLTELEKKA